MTNIVYLAVPFSSEDKEVMKERVLKVNKCAGKLLLEGHVVFSPISMHVPIKDVCDLPGTWEYWERVDRAFLERCSHLFVLKLDGWKTSVGVQAEIKIAKDLGLPVIYLEEDFIN